MKQVAFLIISVLFSFTSCTKDVCNREVTYLKATAIYHDLETLRLPIVSEFDAPLIKPSKIFVHGNYLFMSEENYGIHILDNRDPENPFAVNFIPIPGNKDLIVKGDHLLADSYYDLLVIDIQEPTQPRLLSRNQEVFPVTMKNNDGEALVGFTYEEVTEKVDCQSFLFSDQTFFFDDHDLLIAPSAVPTSFAGSKSSDGTRAGSLSRMASMDNYLYVISQSSIHAFEMIGTSIEARDVITVGGNFETIFPLENRLFIGAQNGMHIFDISNRSSPEYIAQFWHSISCDPVYPTEEVAYVTLRTGNTCEGSVNQLNVISLAQISNPTLVQLHEMQNPHGLTLLNDKLIVCEGQQGIKIFDARDRSDLTLIATDYTFTAYDVIPHPDLSGVLLIIGNEGLIQYQLNGENKLTALSTIGF